MLMKAKIIVEYTMSNICNKEDLEESPMLGNKIINTLEKMVKYLIKEEGLFGVVDDKYKILKIEEIK